MLNPIKTQLTILQQEGYSTGRFLKWWITHPFTYFVSNKKPLVLTQKVRRLLAISYVLFGLLLLLSIVYKFLIVFPFSAILFLIEPFIFLFAAILIITPFERIHRRRTINRVRKEVLGNPDLTVIGIAGSFGKTSVKDFLFTILSGYQETLKTPESYNTIFGIAKVVDFELLKRTKFFICEMGAYIRGEIAEICRMVPPKYAILTAIGTQHLERFKNLENTTSAKFELINSVQPNHALVNLDNSFIADRLTLPKYSGINTYSLFNSQADFFIKKYSFSSHGLSFTLVHQDKAYTYNSSLFGTSNLYNLTAAICMAMMLKVPEQVISKQVTKITSSPHRLEIKKINKATLIDNAFSSNEEGFTTLINDLSKLPGKKVLITPGIVELGIRTVEVHQKLGQLSSTVFDKFILVGKSLRTFSFEQGLSSSRAKSRDLTPLSSSRKRGSIPITYIPNSTNLWPLIEELSKEFDWILLENDLPDTF